VSALRLNEAERWRGAEQVFRGTYARTTPALSFDTIEGVPNERVHQR
jgi:hypothetical protein